MNKNIRQINFDAGNNEGKKYKVEAIKDCLVYKREFGARYLSGLYYLVF